MSLDAHVHLWQRATDPQPWIDPASMAAIDRDFTSDDLDRMLDATAVDAAVVVQSVNSAAETRRLLAYRNPRIAGVVGWTDLTGDVAAFLGGLDPEQHRRLAGIRHLVHVDPDPGWLGQACVGTALERIAAEGLGFDLVVRSWQLPLAAAVADAHPGVRFVLDHLGGIADTDDDAGWASSLRRLAVRPNTRAKISGLAAMNGDQNRLRRVAGVALDAFGPDRLMYGSDWPLAELGAGPVGWRNTVQELISGLSAAERLAIMSGTASTFYRINS